MKIIHVNTHDITGGASRTAYRLHIGLQKIGIESFITVQYKRGGSPDVNGPISPLAKLFGLLKPDIQNL